MRFIRTPSDPSKQKQNWLVEGVVVEKDYKNIGDCQGFLNSIGELVKCNPDEHGRKNNLHQVSADTKSFRCCTPVSEEADNCGFIVKWKDT